MTHFTMEKLCAAERTEIIRAGIVTGRSVRVTELVELGMFRFRAAAGPKKLVLHRSDLAKPSLIDEIRSA